MFGWEYPPHVFGGLATANYGITHGLNAQGDIETLLCLPRPFGDEEQDACKIIGMNCVPIVWRDVNYDYVKQRIGDIMSPEDYYRYRDHLYADFNYMHVNDLGCMEFAGGYPQNLTEEINNYSIIAGVVARTEKFDIIHAHDWLTYPAGIHAKQVSGRPLVIHVHATDFDRSRGNVNPTVYGIERNGMGILRARDAALLSKHMSRIKDHVISFDMVVHTMNETGEMIPIELKETSEGGLAKEYLSVYDVEA